MLGLACWDIFNWGSIVRPPHSICSDVQIVRYWQSCNCYTVKLKFFPSRVHRFGFSPVSSKCNTGLDNLSSLNAGDITDFTKGWTLANVGMSKKFSSAQHGNETSRLVEIANVANSSTMDTKRNLQISAETFSFYLLNFTTMHPFRGYFFFCTAFFL